MNDTVKITPKYDVFGDVPLVKARRFGAGGGGSRGPRGSIYPVEQLEVGMAFFVSAGDEEVGAVVKRVQSAVTRIAKQKGFKLAVRNLPASDDANVNPWGDPGVGVWRIAGEYVYKPREKKAA